jgi:hypothetical protein
MIDMVQESSTFQYNFVCLKPNLSPYQHLEKWLEEYLDQIRLKGVI